MARPEGFMKRYFDYNLALTKEKLRKSAGKDTFISQCVSNIEDIDKAANLLSKRLREWYELYNPELSRATPDHAVFASLITAGTDEKPADSMGSPVSPEDRVAMVNLAKRIADLYTLRKEHEAYLDETMEAFCPNIHALAGTLVGAKLIAQAGTLKRLAELTSSTVQLLGAEKALFRHLTTGARSPKHGIILQHPLLQRAKAADRGKVARALADKISLAARLDFFKGQFMGDTLREELEKRFRQS
jgi:nucleolar protein 56